MKTKILLSSLLCGFLIGCGGGSSSSNGSNENNQTSTQTVKSGFITTENIPDDIKNILDGEQTSRFIISGDKAVMTGVIWKGTIDEVKKLIREYPAVETIIMENVEGSIDDESNLIASRLVREAGLNTKVLKNGVIASGGTDFFIAGVKREVEEGGKVGVHSWSDESGTEASKLPTDDASHQSYINYYKDMGLPDPSGFYFFTINSADASSIYYMSQDELKKYGLIDGNVTTTETNTILETNATDELSTIKRSIPSSFGDSYQKYFVKYTFLTAPNGKAINIFAQDKISDEKMLRAKHILEFYLTDYEGSVYGSDKSAVKNKMADNGATLLLLNGTDDGTNPASEVGGQPLFENEIQIEGGTWYVAQNYEHRDASYEEILHLVHDNGIGVDGENGTDGVLPKFQAKIRASQANALSKKIWTADDETIKEWTNENSLTQEYLASVIDAYYGLWGAWDEQTDTSMWGLYQPRDRAEIKTEDPQGYEVMDNQFFHPYITYNARIDESFTGTFSLKFDASIPYTYHSRYLKDITLLGSNNTNVRVNELNNSITGNSGENEVIFSSSSDEYTISTKDEVTTVTDNKENRDGTNSLENIEKITFSNETINL